MVGMKLSKTQLKTQIKGPGVSLDSFAWASFLRTQGKSPKNTTKKSMMDYSVKTSFRGQQELITAAVTTKKLSIYPIGAVSLLEA